MRAAWLTPTSRPTREVQTVHGVVVLQQLTWAQMQDARRAALDGDTFSWDLYCLALLTLSARDADGVPIFDATLQDREALKQMPDATLQPLMAAVLELHALVGDAAGKDSAATPSTGVSSGSAATTANSRTTSTDGAPIA